MEAASNVQKMRGVLDDVLHFISDIEIEPYSPLDEAASELKTKVMDALALPLRQCDVGTPEEQIRRLYEGDKCPSCKHPRMTDDGCACMNEGPCALRWAQTPYEAEEGGAK